MAPAISRAAFAIAVAILIMGLFTLLYVEPGSPEFVATILALVLATVFLGLLTWYVRRAARLPMYRPSEQGEPTLVRREGEEQD